MHDQTIDTRGRKKATSRLRRILLNRWLMSGIAAMVLYATLGFFLAPWIITRYVCNYAVEKLERKASIAEVRINPFLLTFEAKDFIFQEEDNRPIIGFGRLFVDFQLSSLFRWAWTFADVRIEQPSLNIEIQQNGRLNFADLAESFPKSKDPPSTDSRPPRLLVHHAEVIDGSLTFSDRSDITHASETFSPLSLKLKEISTIPERKGPYTIKADVPGGGKIGWQGEISLHPFFSEGKLSISGFKLATAWKFFQDELNLEEPAGDLDISSRYRFDYQKRIALLVLQDATFTLKGLLLTEKGKNTPLLTLETIEASDIRFDLQARELMISNVVVRNGSVSASINKKGLLDWQKLVAQQKPTDESAPPPGILTSDSHPWHLNVEAVKVENIAVSFTDRSRSNPVALTVDSLNVLLNASAGIGTGPVKAIVDDLEVALNRISVSEAGDDTPVLSLDTLLLNDGRIDIGSRELTIARVRATGGKTSVIRSKNGRIRLIQMFVPEDKKKMVPDIVETGMKTHADGKPWSFSLNEFEMNGFQIALQDLTITPAIVYDLKDIQVSLKNLTNDGQTPIDFKTDFKVAQGGKVKASGLVSQTGDRADARAKLMMINLKQLRPAITKFTSLTLESGNISALAQVRYRSKKSGPQLYVNGSVNVNKLALNEEDTGDRFLEWKEMSANGLKFGLSPDGLHIEEVRLLEPGAKVVIFKDRSINLSKVLKSSDPAKNKAATQPEQPQIVAPSKDRILFPISVERVLVEKGVVDYADLSLVLPFATHVTDFSGGATGISSDPASRTMVKLHGKVDEYGLTMVSGGINPFAPKTFTDISVSFQNVEMKPLSPYSATFAGRKIASGTLNLKLEYKIQNSELLGDNEVVLEQFTLGDRVEATKAINLPLDLAIALLTDSEGKINVAVPVSGNVDNPKFSYGHVVWQALVNLITKAVTAPFRALGSLLGDKSEQMDAISFQPGSDRLLPPELKKLKNVVGALEKRPKLKLVVHGRFDTKIDGEALRTERVVRAIAEQMGVKLAPDDELMPVAFNNVKTQKALEKLLKMSGGNTAITNFMARYEKATGKKAKRTNFAMALIGLASSDTDFYQAMFEELVRLEHLSDNDLRDLAQRRAEAIVQELKTTQGLDETRVIAGSPGPAEKASMNAINTRLKLDVIKPSA